MLQPKVFVQFVCVPFNSCARKIDSFSASSGHMGVDDTTHFATTVSAGIFDKQLVHKQLVHNFNGALQESGVVKKNNFLLSATTYNKAMKGVKFAP